MRALYEGRPVDRLPRYEFYVWIDTYAKWREQGLPDNWEEINYFNYDPPFKVSAGGYGGWVDVPLMPQFEAKTLEETEDYEIIQDISGRILKVFKGRRQGFMPEYLAHSVTSMKDWEEKIAPRMDPSHPGRWVNLEAAMEAAKRENEANDTLICQQMIGGYMYMRALVGPVELLYMFHDNPDLIHAMMQGWYNLMNTILERVQEKLELDQIELAEDICFNHGLLISPATWNEFLYPYYKKLLDNARSRQKRYIYVMIDTDGYAVPAIPVYSKIGMDIMSPWEVASGCDVVKIGRENPNLIMYGGIDKRVLASTKDAIDKHLQYIIPAMLKRGRYYPTCDHGVPSDVSLENYSYYRQRVCELDH